LAFFLFVPVGVVANDEDIKELPLPLLLELELELEMPSTIEAILIFEDRSDPSIVFDVVADTVVDIDTG